MAFGCQSTRRSRVTDPSIRPVHDRKSGVRFDMREEAVRLEYALIEVSRVRCGAGQYLGLEHDDPAGPQGSIRAGQ